MESFIKTTLSKAGTVIDDAFPNNEITYKARQEAVTQTDRDVEQLIRDEIREAHPEHGIIGEEFSNTNPDEPSQWIIDPIDGTTNFSHNIPFFCSAMAYVDHGVVTYSGVVSPIHDTIWTASKGKGAKKDGELISQSDPVDVSEAVIGFCHGSEEESRTWLTETLSSFKSDLNDARQFGAADLELCLVASGDLNGFVGHHINPWDFLPGCLIASEAGCTVTGFDQEDWETDDQDSVVAAHPSIHDALLDIAR